MARTYWLYLLGTRCSIELWKAHIKNLNKLVKFKQNSFPVVQSSSEAELEHLEEVGERGVKFWLKWKALI